MRTAVDAVSRPDPAKQLARRRRRARRSLAVRTTVSGGLLAAALLVGDQAGTVEWGEVLAGTGSGIAAVGAVQSARRVMQLRRIPDPVAAPAPPPLPQRGSVARPPLERLASRERSLRELILVLGPAAGTTWAEASTAAAALREQGNRLVAVERAVKGATEPSAELLAAQRTMLARLQEGVSAYDRLVGAAAEAVAASGGEIPDTGAASRLQESADALLGLARGLKEIADLPRQARPTDLT